MPDGLVDTNVVIHAQTQDAHSEDYRKGMVRQETAEDLLAIYSKNALELRRQGVEIPSPLPQ